MTDKRIKRVIAATKKNYSFGVPIAFDGRCIQAYPNGKNSFRLCAGCYTSLDNLIEYNALVRTGAAIRTYGMGNQDQYVSFEAILTESQLAQYLDSADFADIDA